MSIEIEAIKDAVYELEGLLELAELREDKLPALLPLMKNKLNLINTLFADSKIEDSADEEIFTDEEVSPIEESPAEIQAEGEMPEMKEAETSIVEETSAPEENANPFISEKIEELTTVKEDYTPDFSSSEEALFVADDTDDTVIFTEPIDMMEKVESGENEESKMKEEKKAEVQATVSSVRPTADPNAPKPAFCINDRFRFRRELFGNSDSAFNSAMDLVATMDDYQEAEDYFLADLGWDPEKPEVMDFMAIIRSYFEK